MVETEAQATGKDYTSLHDELKRSKPAIQFVLLKGVFSSRGLEREIKDTFERYKEVSRNVGEKLGKVVGFREGETSDFSHSFMRTVVGLAIREFSDHHAMSEDLLWGVIDPRGYLLKPEKDPATKIRDSIKIGSMVEKASRGHSLDDDSHGEENGIKEIFEEVYGTNLDNIPRQMSALREAGFALGSQFAESQLNLEQLKRTVDFHSRIIASFRTLSRQ